ncbi:hypothetical protein ACFXPW_13340 [Streptomyces goshikiensis]|uniref:hypothetical protein n=1 Tax=Streptomyces goshikiensis TaxID=1942 RepID=UPI00368A3558
MTSQDAARREAAADSSTDWASDCGPGAGKLVAGVLAICASQESNSSALEAQLNALLQLAEFLDPDIAQHLNDIDTDSHPEILRDYISDILST